MAASTFSSRFAVGGLGRGFFPLCARISLVVGVASKPGERGEQQQRLVHGLRYGMGYARTTGRGDGLGADGRILKDRQKI
jgi:hypothetical protein